MNNIASAIVGIGLIALGFYGYNTDIVGSGWLVFIGVLAAIKAA